MSNLDSNCREIKNVVEEIIIFFVKGNKPDHQMILNTEGEVMFTSTSNL